MEITKQIQFQTKPEQEQQETQFPIHGDLLEFMFTHVPLIHLVPALHVSPAWKRSVLTSLRRFSRVKPWLVLHTQSTRSPYSLSLHAFDPRSQIWIRILPLRKIQHVSALRSSDSNLVYMISPSKLSFSVDPLYQNWTQIDAPPKWRTDPVVALVGRRIVVAGGTCDFEDDPLAVEIYDLETRRWDTSGEMPAVFKDSAAATWLSVAVAGDRMLIMHKTTGISHWFDPETKIWVGPFNLFTDPKIYRAEIGFANERLILIGFIGDGEGKMCGLKMWEISGDSPPESLREVGEMPVGLVEKLRGEDFGGLPAAVVVNVIGDYVYVSNSLSCEDVFLCEICGGAYNWRSFPNLVVNEKMRLSERIVFSCGNVELVDLHKATDEGVKFDVVGKC